MMNKELNHQLTSARGGKAPHVLIAYVGQKLEILMSPKAFPASEKKALQTRLGGSGVKVIAGTCVHDEQGYCFRLPVDPGQLDKRIAQTLKTEVNNAVAVRVVRGEDEADGQPAAATGSLRSMLAALPGAMAAAVGQPSGAPSAATVTAAAAQALGSVGLSRFLIFEIDIAGQLDGALRERIPSLPIRAHLQLEAADPQHVKTMGMELQRLNDALDVVKQTLFADVKKAVTRLGAALDALPEPHNAAAVNAANEACAKEIREIAEGAEKAMDAVTGTFMQKLHIEEHLLKKYRVRVFLSLALPTVGLVVGLSMMIAATPAGPLLIPAFYGLMKSAVQLMTNLRTAAQSVDEVMVQVHGTLTSLYAAYEKKDLTPQPLPKKMLATMKEAGLRITDSLSGISGNDAKALLKNAGKQLESARGKCRETRAAASDYAEQLNRALDDQKRLEIEILRYAQQAVKAESPDRAAVLNRVTANLKIEREALKTTINKLQTRASELTEKAALVEIQLDQWEQEFNAFDEAHNSELWKLLDVPLKLVDVGTAFADPSKATDIAANVTPAVVLLTGEKAMDMAEVGKRVFQGTALKFG